MKYTLTKRNKSTDAATHFDFVKWMRRNDILYWENNKDFMQDYSYRKFYFEKTILRTDDERVFVEDLVETGLLTIEGKPTLIEQTKGNLKSLFANLFDY